MRVRLLMTISGTRNGEPWPPAGNVVDLPDDEALHMIEREQAIPDTDFRSAETAVVTDRRTETRTATERPLTVAGTGLVPPKQKGSK
jgi:hypothetical protein